MDNELTLRIVLVNPPVGVNFGLQQGSSDVVDISTSDGSSLSFECVVRVRAQKDGSPNFLGEFTQGPASARFVYVNSGKRAAQPQSCWDRRAKVPLSGIEWPLIEQAIATPEAVLEASISGLANDGGPCCASVPLLERWELKRSR
jgi:hypothetical protein